MDALLAFHVVVGFTLAALAANALLNHRRLPRLEQARPPARPPRIAVLIPARNEAPRIAAAVQGWAAQVYPDYEVVVYDDESTDATAARARAAARGAPRVRVVRGGGLPPGWRGKPWACHRLRAETRAEVLVFADADVRPAPPALASLAASLSTLGVDALSAIPAHRSPSAAVRALTPIQSWAPLAFIPAWLPAVARRPLFAALNGQLIAVRATAYDAVGGFAAVRQSLAEDAALGRRLAAGGHGVRLLDGSRLLSCRSYASLRELWRANVRNLLPVFFGSGSFLVFAAAGLAILYLGPPFLLLLGVVRGGAAGPWIWLPLAEIGLGLVPRLYADRRAGYPVGLALLHPVAVAALVAMSLHSLVRFRWQGTVEWRGRRYEVDDGAA